MSPIAAPGGKPAFIVSVGNEQTSRQFGSRNDGIRNCPFCLVNCRIRHINSCFDSSISVHVETERTGNDTRIHAAGNSRQRDGYGGAHDLAELCFLTTRRRPHHGYDHHPRRH